MFVRRVVRKRPAPERRVHSVQEATRIVRGLLERSLTGLWVAGEISNLRRPGSGHAYFTLKDDRAQLGAVLFKDALEAAGFPLRDGLEVIVYGSITVYEPRGVYQIAVQTIEPRGVGAAQLALEALKRKLEAEGLFDPRRKRPLPRFPRTIALVTSATGAAVKDMLEVIDRRYPCVRVLLCPVRVQGELAAAEVTRAVRAVGRHGRADVLIVGRGGGSKEDLWAFNDEALARAIAASPVPVVSSVGHAIDTTVADLVADRRALTPTEAAELCTPVLSEVVSQLQTMRARLGKALLRSARDARTRLRRIEQSYALRRPRERLRGLEQGLDELGARLERSVRVGLAKRREQVDALAARLDGLSPLRVLARGYSVTYGDGRDEPLLSADQVARGARLLTRLAEGEVVSEVIEVRAPAAGIVGGAEDAETGGGDAG